MSSHNVYALCRSAYVALGARLWKYFIGALALSYSGFIRPRGAGFYCDDQSIKFPYRGDTISVPQLFLGSLLAPIFFIFPVEFFKRWGRYGRQMPIRSYLHSAWLASWQVWRAVLLGNLTVLVLTEFSKSLISEARPHFWDTCKPNVTREMCESGFISEFNCTSTFSTRKILDAQKSFPSGHTSLSAFVALFMMWYLARAVTWGHSCVFKPCLQLLWAAFAIVCGLTRITDKRHHWWDVLAGFTLGVSVALVLIQAMSRSIRWSEENDSSHDSSNSAVDQFHHSNRGDSVGNNTSGGVQLKPSGNPPTGNNQTSVNNSNKRLSVRRLLSTSSTTTTIAEDGEINSI